MNLRENDEEEIRENYTTKNFMTCTPRQTYMRLEEHVALMVRREMCIEFWWGSLK